MKNFSIPWLELNVVLIFCGFSLFTTIVYGNDSGDAGGGNSLSILYRAFACILSVFCIYKGEGIPTLKAFKGALLPYLFVMVLMTIRLVHDLVLATDSHTWSNNTKLMHFTMYFGAVLVPNMSVICTFKQIRWDKVIKMLFCALLFINIVGFISTRGMSGRLALNSHQSTLAYGANGAYLAILAASILSVKQKDFIEKWLKIVVIGALILGIVSVFRAASRGPLLGLVIAFAAVVVTKKNVLAIIAGVGIISVFLGEVIRLYLQANASTMYIRLMDTIEKGDSSGRDVIFVKAVNYFLDAPLTGSVFSIREGLGGACGPHNFVLHVAMACGLIGLLLILLCYFLLFKDCVRLKGISTIESRFFIGCCFYFFMRTMTGVDFYFAYDFLLIIVCVSLYTYNHLNNQCNVSVN